MSVRGGSRVCGVVVVLLWCAVGVVALLCGSVGVVCGPIAAPDTECTLAACKVYDARRLALVHQELAQRFDAHITLNDKEAQVQEILNALKDKEINATGTDFPPSYNFRDVKPLIDQSALLPIIKAMPKGGMLHIHSILDSEFVFKTGSYHPYCYVNVGKNSTAPGTFLYAAQQPAPANGSVWANVVNLRKQAANVTEFDENLFKTLQFYTPTNMTENNMWLDFDSTIYRLAMLGAYYPIFRSAFLDGIDKLVKDGIFHFEIRGIHPPYDFDGWYSNQETIELFISLVAEYNKVNKQNVTFCVIYALNRYFPVASVYEGLVATAQLREKYPGIVVGFDLVDQEDRFNSLYYYLEDFIQFEEYLTSHNLKPMNYYFHAGETAWDTGRAEDNLYDAVLLNTTRIGHGFALKNHPLLLDIVKSRKIAIEVCPISNQLLRLLTDMRNHPANIFAAYGVPFTLSSDDPAIYGYAGVSYDFWEAFMSWDLDLKGLKQLTINSIEYSALPDAQKQQQLAHLDDLWHNWIDGVLKGAY